MYCCDKKHRSCLPERTLRATFRGERSLRGVRSDTHSTSRARADLAAAVANRRGQALVEFAVVCPGGLPAAGRHPDLRPMALFAGQGPAGRRRGRAGDQPHAALGRPQT